MVDAAAAIDRLRTDRRLLPRLATLIENEDPRGLDLLDALYPYSGQAHVVGITGPPGVGKSALVGVLIEAIRGSGRGVAVVAVDPTSPFSSGALLGDRIRMMQHHADEGVFVRSMASRGRTGGLAWATAEMVHLLDAASFPLVLVETVGTGQDGTDIAQLADTVVVLTAPGLGDGVQAMKSGLLEAGDILVVTKADRPGASETVRSLRAALSLGPPNERRAPVLATSATSGTGIAELLDAIDAHRAWLAESGCDRTRRARSARAEVLAALRVTIERRLDAAGEQSPAFAAAIARVAERKITARRAASLIAVALNDPLVGAASGSIGDERGGRTGANTIVNIDYDEPGRA